MAPLNPTWTQPSHPLIQKVVRTSTSASEFTTKSISTIALAPFAVFAPLAFPPCSVASGPTYATVQCGRDEHLNLNSDLVYVNHSCEPSLIFDLSSPSPSILAGPKGLRPGDELTFFYPSTEWSMAQPFDCFCGAASCRGRIAGARDMNSTDLQGVFLNGFIRDMLAEREADPGKTGATDRRIANLGRENENTHAWLDNSNPGPQIGQKIDDHAAGDDMTIIAEEHVHSADSVEQTLMALLEQARIALQLAEDGLTSYRKKRVPSANGNGNGANGSQGNLQGCAGSSGDADAGSGTGRAGPTSRELSGEMGGDTSVAL